MTDGSFSGGVGPRGNRALAEIEALRERFLNYSPKNRNDMRQGLLGWRSADGKRDVQLIVAEHPDYGVSHIWSPSWSDGEWREVITVSDETKLHKPHLVDTDCDNWIPIGSFLPIETAWMGIEDFFSEPTVPSPRLTWVETRKIRLPHLG